MMQDVLERMKAEGSMWGSWNVLGTKNGVVWGDASSIAMGVIREVRSVEVEDAAWLRKKDDCSHTNVAELDAEMEAARIGSSN